MSEFNAGSYGRLPAHPPFLNQMQSPFTVLMAANEQAPEGQDGQNGHHDTPMEVDVAIATTATLDQGKYRAETLAIHADDKLNLYTDVAPALHVSTTFRYDNDNLNPTGDEGVSNARGS